MAESLEYTDYEDLRNAGKEIRDFTPKPRALQFAKPSEAQVAEYQNLENPIEPVNRDSSIWTKLAYLDAPGNAVRNFIGKASEGEVSAQNAIDGLKRDEVTYGTDLINLIGKKMSPGTYAQWEISRNAAILTPEQEVARIMNGDPREQSTPFGLAGSIAGFGLEILLDPLTYVTAGLGPLANKAALATRTAKVGKTAARLRINQNIALRKKIAADADVTVNSVKTGELLGEAGIRLPTNFGEVVGNNVSGETIEAAGRLSTLRESLKLDRRAREITGGARVSIVRDADGISIKGFDKRSQGKLTALATRASKGSKGAQEKLDQLVELASEKSKIDELLGHMDNEEIMLGLQGTVITDHPELLGDIVEELNGHIEGLAGPVQSAIQSTDVAEVGVARLGATVADIAEYTEDLAAFSDVGTGTSIFGLGQMEFGAAVETWRLNHEFMTFGQELAGRGFDKSILNPKMMDTVRDAVKIRGVSNEVAEKMAPGLVDAIELADDMSSFMKDVNHIDNISVRSPVEMLERFDADQLAMSGLVNNTIRAMARKLTTNRFGLGIVNGKTIGAGTMSKAEAKAMDHSMRALKLQHDAWMVDGSDRISSVAEALFGRKASVTADFIEDRLGAVPGAQQFARAMRAPNPLGGDVEFVLGLRDPERVFRGTGVYELLRDRSKTMVEAKQFYGRRWKEVTGGMKRDERIALGRILDGQDVSDLPIEIRAAAENRSVAARKIFDDLADLVGLEKERRVVNYFPRIWEKDGKQAAALAGGHLAPELSRSRQTLGWIVDTNDVGVPFDSRFIKNSRKADAEGFVLDANEVFNVYRNSVLKAHYISPSMEEARDILFSVERTGPGGRSLRPGGSEATRRAAAGKPVGRTEGRSSIGVVDAVDEKGIPTRSKQLLAYFDNLERVIHGQPTRATEHFFSQVDEMAARFGIENGTAYSKATGLANFFTGMIYRSALGFNLPTYGVNVTQNILTAGENGVFNVLKPMAKIFVGQDPIEGLHAAARESGERALRKSSRPDSLRGIIDNRLGIGHNDLREIHDATSIGGMATNLARGYDKLAFLGMEKTEKFNRGIAYHVGMTQALKENLSPIEAMRMAHMVSDETQFFYGVMGRGPVFNNPLTRPIIGTFTSFPAKMVGVANRMMTENPTAMVRYMSLVGGAAGAVARTGLDPKALLPHEALPDRYQLYSGLTPLLRIASSGLRLFAAEEDTPEAARAMQDLVMAMPFITGVPVTALSTGYHVGKVMTDGEIRSRRDMFENIPFIKDFAFSGELPTIMADISREPQLKRIYIAVAKSLGFNTQAEEIASAVIERVRKMRTEKNEIRADAVRILRDNESYADLSDGEIQAIRDYVQIYGITTVDGMVESVNNTYKTAATRAMDSQSRAEQRMMTRGISDLARNAPNDARSALDLLGTTKDIRDATR